MQPTPHPIKRKRGKKKGHAATVHPYAATERVLHLMDLLLLNVCTRKDIFTQLFAYYRADDTYHPQHKVPASASKMLERDLGFLEKHMGLRLEREQKNPTDFKRYRLVAGTGKLPALLFTPQEIETLALLHTLFARPAVPENVGADGHAPVSPPRHPFAEAIAGLVTRLMAALPAEQQAALQRQAHRPHIYLNLHTVTDYHDHRATIERLTRAIRQRQQIAFLYTSPQREAPLSHRPVDPYYLTQLDGHFLLIGFDHAIARHSEYRIDRIQPGSIEILPSVIDQERQQHPIVFRYWADEVLVQGGMSERWLTQTIERTEVTLVEGQPRRRVLIRATAYSEWRIIQQLHRYGDKVALIEPPALRQRMREELTRALAYYQ